MTSTNDFLAKRPVGRTGLLVTPIGMGTAPLGSPEKVYGFEVDDERAAATLRAFLDGPLNLLDTAAIYGNGRAEARIGAVLRERGGRPSGLVLETKADRDPATGEWSAAQMRRSVEGSLQRLGLDRLQICLIHDTETSTWEHVTAPGGPLDELVRMRDEGLIGHLGIGAGPVEMIMRYVETGLMEVVMTHNRFNLLDRQAEPLLDLCRARGVAVFNAGAYGSGILAKDVTEYSRFRYRPAEAAVVERVRRMGAACARYGVPLGAAALQFSLRDPRVTSTVVGMSRPERVAETLALATARIPDALWPELDAIASDKTGLPEDGKPVL